MDIRHAVGVKAGIAAEKLAALERHETDPAFSERERAALAYAEAITADAAEVPEACFARVREHFSDPEILELVFITGYQAFASKFAKALAVAPQGFADAVSS
jgi:alkylhydroperoxidase family enzyme